MYLIKPPGILRWLNPDVIWRLNKKTNTIYLTFDDGPTPGITSRVLDLLDKYKAQATFFCTGNNAQQYPELIKTIKEKGHRIGNHTYNHENGSLVKFSDYMQSVDAADEVIHSKLFRPPYGVFNRSIKKALFERGCKIVMWDIVCGDFDDSLSPEQVFKNIKNNIRDGSVILMHDSQKAYPRNLIALERLLEEFQAEFHFSTIPYEI